MVPQPPPTVLCYSHGGFLSHPFHNMLFPRGLRLCEGSQAGPQASPGSTPVGPVLV